MNKKSLHTGPKEETKRCYIYACQGSDRKDVEGEDIPMQVADCKKYAEQNGWEVVRVIQDENRLSDDGQRPGLMELSNAISGANLDILLVRRLDYLINCTDQLKTFIGFTLLNRVALRSVAEDGPGGTYKVRVEFHSLQSDFAEE